jgi:hypothetical protein
MLSVGSSIFSGRIQLAHDRASYQRAFRRELDIRTLRI